MLSLYFFLNVLGLHCCTGAFSSCGDREGYSPAAGCRLLLAAASLVAKFGLQGTRTSVVVAEGLVAPQHVGSSGPRMELVSPALAGGFLTTWALVRPPGCSSQANGLQKLSSFFLNWNWRQGLESSFIHDCRNIFWPRAYHNELQFLLCW